MIINCFYDEDEQYPDIIYIPRKIENVNSLQEDFFKWIFDEEKSNAQFTEFEGMKGCMYDTENFIYWLNEVYFTDENISAYIIEKNASRWNSSDFKLFF